MVFGYKMNLENSFKNKFCFFLESNLTKLTKDLVSQSNMAILQSD